MNLTEIQDLIKLVSKTGVAEVEIEQKDFKIVIKSDGKKKRGIEPQIIQQSIPVAIPSIQSVPQTVLSQQPITSAHEAATVKEEEDSKYVTIKSPIIGTFYRSSSPDTPAFVNVGDSISTGSVICIIEAMKLFNEIEAEISGKIIKVLVDDSSPVEFDQPLFLVDPS